MSGGGKPARTATKTRALLDYAAPADHSFSAAEVKSLVRAISEIKIFDPAAGSGAFPMGVLHLLTLALSRLDPQNAEWRELQKTRALTETDKALDKTDKSERGERLDEINEIFSRYSNSDFGRKLFLIQNSIFGADIQAGRVSNFQTAIFYLAGDRTKAGCERGKLRHKTAGRIWKRDSSPQIR